MAMHSSADPGPDVIQVVLTPRHFLNPNSSLMQNQHPQHLQKAASSIPSSYVGYHTMTNTISPSLMYTSSAINTTQIQAHQLRELVREKLLAEGVRLSAPPYTIPTVRKVLLIYAYLYYIYIYTSTTLMKVV